MLLKSLVIIFPIHMRAGGRLQLRSFIKKQKKAREKADAAGSKK